MGGVFSRLQAGAWTVCWIFSVHGFGQRTVRQVEIGWPDGIACPCVSIRGEKFIFYIGKVFWGQPEVEVE